MFWFKSLANQNQFSSRYHCDIIRAWHVFRETEMGTMMLLSLVASTIALSTYFMWKAFRALPKQPIIRQAPQPHQPVHAPDGNEIGS